MIPLALGAWLGAACVVAGGSLLYLANPNQRLLSVAAGLGAVLLGVVLLLAGLVFFLAVMGAPAAVATWCVAFMLTVLALPFVALLSNRRP